MKYLTLFLVFFIFLCSCNSQAQSNNDKPSEKKKQKKINTIQPNKNGKVTLTEKEWEEKLTKMQYHVLRQQGTERPFANEYFNSKEKGIYRCGACGAKLFSSSTKFKSGTGWPSFYQPVNKKMVGEIVDKSHGRTRTEVVCNRCDSHLGHVFEDGPKPTGLRYCINSAALQLDVAKAKKEDKREQADEIEKDK